MYITTKNITIEEFNNYKIYCKYFNLLSTHCRNTNKTNGHQRIPVEISELNINNPKVYEGVKKYYGEPIPSNQFILHKVKIVNSSFIFDDKHYITFKKLYNICRLNEIVFCDVRVTVLKNMLIFTIIQDSINISSCLLINPSHFAI